MGILRYLSTAVSGRHLSTSVEDIFIKPSTQKLLSSLVLSSMHSKQDRVFAPQRVKRNRSKITLMTEEEYEKNLKAAFRMAQSHMQPFPVKMPFRDAFTPGAVLQTDPELNGLSSSRHVFVDLSAVPANEKNVVVVREPQGDLRTATEEERSRMINMFFPQKVPGRTIKVPALFREDSEHLQVELYC